MLYYTTRKINMNLNLKLFQKMSAPEYVLLGVFIIYILFPISTPIEIASFIDSPLGYVGIFIITLLLFVYTSPILGVLYIFVAYELIRRSSFQGSVKQNAQRLSGENSTQYMPTHVPKVVTTQSEKDTEMASMNPSRETTLEEEIVELRAPIGKSDPVKYTESSFKPVADKLIGASMY
jgi:hypothetical protein